MSIFDRIQQALSCRYWTVAYRKRAAVPLYENGSTEGFCLLARQKFVTQADPFLFNYEGREYLFYEVQSLDDMKGEIWCTCLDGDMKPVRVLAEAFHLSYPQVFEYGGDIFMVPETRQAGELRVYRCEHFPETWRLYESSLPLKCVDTTLLPGGEEGGIFYTYADNRLRIYSFGSGEHFTLKDAVLLYEGEKDAQKRPGGHFIKDNGRLLRPAQDCRDYYGKELLFYEVLCPYGAGKTCADEAAHRATETGADTASPGQYTGDDAEAQQSASEREVYRLRPEKLKIKGVRPEGIHTYNSDERYEVIDILHCETGVSVLLKKLKWKRGQ